MSKATTFYEITGNPFDPYNWKLNRKPSTREERRKAERAAARNRRKNA